MHNDMSKVLPSSSEERKSVPKKFFAKHKTEAVLRIFRGESLEIISRELGVPAATLTEWKERFLAAGIQSFAKKTPAQETEIQRYTAKIGEQSMENELLREKIAKMEQKSPLAFRRSKK